jgi:hypothetical protein
MQLKQFLRRSAQPETPLARAERLVCEGRLVEAVDVLATESRDEPDPMLPVRLLDLRRQAALGYAKGDGRSPWPPAYTDPFPDVTERLPEIDAAELTAEVMGGAVAHHGCLLVRGVLDEGGVARTIAAIDRAQTARDRPDAERSEGLWYRPFESSVDVPQSVRDMVAGQGGTWLADSPAGAALVLDDLKSAGLVAAIAEHFGERPFISLQKSTLRRSLPVNKLTAWHQDGSFLGSEVRTMNVWVALSTCGADHPAPGIEVVPKRVDDILPTEGKLGQSSISFDLVAEIAADAPVTRPEFLPGDGMMFDERFLHRTYLSPDMTDDRYALECWFFAPSHGAEQYVSFLV